MSKELRIAAVVFLILGPRVLPAGAVGPGADLERRFAETVHPFLETYCTGCHGKEKQKGQMDLSVYTSLDTINRDYRRWETVLGKLKAAEMPPEEAKKQPPAKLRRAVVDWIQAERAYEAQRNAGDPGPVLARRLSNAEYDYTIRDLTGADLRPAKEFPVDPANEAGFDNSGESLTMSPALLKKYLEAARFVAAHLILTPAGFAFAPHPVVTDTDRDKYAVRRIIEFYQRQSTNCADYFVAAWRFQNRAALGQPKAALADFAGADKLSPKYLATVWSILTEAREETGPNAALRALWRELPAPDGIRTEAARAGCERMGGFVAGLRQRLKPETGNLALRGISGGSQAFVLWRDRQLAANHTRRNARALEILGDPKVREKLTPDSQARQALVVPADEAARGRYESEVERFCANFPDAFYVSERGPTPEDRGRLLSAGFHLMTGYFRDDAPLRELVLDERGRRELDTLWEELDFATAAPMRQYKDFLFFERAEPPRYMRDSEFDFARPEDNDATSEEKIKKLSELYLAKARRNASGDRAAIESIQQHFELANTNIRRVEAERHAAEPAHLAALQTFAERAYRRPLSQTERDGLRAFYQTLRKQDGLDHEAAIRDSVAGILMSPYFCYRVDALPEPELVRGKSEPESGPARATPGVQPLSDYALASRLSYFLWSSLPDQELLARAAAGELHHPKVLAAQARRMLQDARIRDFSTEFGGNWLDFRRFEEHNAVDRRRFPSFDNDLRSAMFEEPVRFLTDVVQNDRAVLDFLYANRTFVNAALARHYGMPEPRAGSDGWERVDDTRPYQRGGLLPMAVFLTKNAPGLRTSPVKRGNWVIRRLLGEQVPPPPPTVPELPADESKLGALTLRETLARHRQDKACAGCHARFDSIGLVFEGYGAVGELRSTDYGGHIVETEAVFPDGSEGGGLDGLRAYLRKSRQDDFLDNLCRKLLAYGLGRGLMLSDEALVQEMRAKLKSQNYRFDVLIETLVTSPQFLNQRVQTRLARQ
jgi:hypothetical protein